MIGEKYLNANCYGTGSGIGRHQERICGFASDNGRTTYKAPTQDRSGVDYENAFGGAHPNAANFILCDGSTITISFAVDPTTFLMLGIRSGRSTPVDMSKLTNTGG